MKTTNYESLHSLSKNENYNSPLYINLKKENEELIKENEILGVLINNMKNENEKLKRNIKYKIKKQKKIAYKFIIVLKIF